MYLDLLDSTSVDCSCGKQGCEFMERVFNEMGGKHVAKPLLKVWQIIDRKYWPEKRAVKGDLYAHGIVPTIDDASLGYWLSKCPSALDKIASCYTKLSSKRVVLDNTKLAIIGEKIADQSEWGIIVLLRDPRGVMNSYKNAATRKKDFRNIGNVVPFCNDFIKSASRLAHKSNAIVIRYEDFCIDPKAVLERICNFIGLGWEDRMLGSIYTPISARGHVVKGNRLLQDMHDTPIQLDLSWEKDLTSEEVSMLYGQKELVPLYESFGYTLTK
jgi:hypothetical protein